MHRLKMTPRRYYIFGLLLGLCLVVLLFLVVYRSMTPSPTPTITTQPAVSARSTTTSAKPSGTSVPPSEASTELTSTTTHTLTPTLQPTDTVTPSPTPSSTPSATPTSTPTPVPAVLLAEADRLLRNGDYASAVDAYQVFLDQHSNHSQAGDAAFGQGKAHYLDGNSTASVLAFETAINAPAFASSHPEVSYWLGRAYAANGDAANAADAFRSYAERQPNLGYRAYQAAGDAYSTVLDAPNAIASYQQALAGAPDTASALRAREGIARISLAAGNPDTAMAQYQAILEIARSPDYRAEILYLLGQAQQVAGRSDSAYASFERATQASPTNHYAYLALLELVNAGYPVDDLLRGRIDVAEGEYWPALSVLHRYMDASPEHSAEAHVLAAHAYEGLGDWTKARNEWQAIIDTHPGDTAEGEAWLGVGRSYWRQDDTTNARQTYLQAVERNPDPESAAQALWWASILQERDDASLPKAAEDYARLAQEFPESDDAGEAAFRSGLSYYRLGDFDKARETWMTLAAADQGLWSAGAEYWLGKILQAENQTEAADEHWQEMTEQWGIGNYYGLRAAQAVAEQSGQDLNSGEGPDHAGDSAPALSAWLRTWTDREVPDDLTQPRPEFAEATALHKIGETTAARSILETLRRSWWNDPVASLQLALHAQELGYFDTSIRAAARAGTFRSTFG